VGSYISQTDIQNAITTAKLAQLTADSGATPDASIVTLFIGLAEEKLNSYLAKRIAVPVDMTVHADAADWFKFHALAIVTWMLWGRRNIHPTNVSEAYKTTIKQLEEYAEGETQVPSAVTPDPTTADDPQVLTGTETLVTGRDNMAGL
jgi:phage gp36-like protein